LSLTLREEHRLRVFKDRLLRKMLGSKRVEGTGDWRILYNVELLYLYFSPNINLMIRSRGVRQAGHV
jgi:hypothetical protein